VERERLKLRVEVMKVDPPVSRKTRARETSKKNQIFLNLLLK
jgi:hypothetical protein